MIRQVSGAACAIMLGVAGTIIAASAAGAQSLQQRLAHVDGRAQVVFASHAGVCGDGRGFIHDSSSGIWRSTSGSWSGDQYGDHDIDCIPGPVRVVATVEAGRVTRMRTYAGPVPAGVPDDVRDLGRVAVRDAVDLLESIIVHEEPSAAEESMLPLVLADSTSPWPELLRIARDSTLARSVRHRAAFWLGRGAAARLGVADESHRTRNDDEDVRASAVFAISRQAHEEAVSRLLELARTSAHREVRNQALFWLGQSDDPRAIDLFAQILR